MQTNRVSVLLVEDNPGDVRLIREMLADCPDSLFHVTHADSLASGLAFLDEQIFQIILLDLSLPDSKGVESFRKMHQRIPEVPIVVLTGLSDEAVGMLTVAEGAQDFLIKGDVSSPLLVRALRYAIERCQTELRLQHLNACLRAIRNVNQLIVTENDPEKLIQNACLRLTDTPGYHFAWIALFDKDKNVIATAENGLGDAFHSLSSEMLGGKLPACVQWAYDVPDVLTIANSQHQCGNCPLASATCNTGAFVMCLKREGNILGLIAAAVPLAFVNDEEEKGLFMEVASDIAYALHGIEQMKMRKKAQDDARTAQKRLELALRSSNVGLWDWNLETDELYLSREWKGQLGYSEEEIASEYASLEKHLLSEDREKTLQKLQAYIRGDIPAYEAEFRMRSKDGDYRWIFAKGEACSLDGRKHMMGCHLDITDRKEAEERISGLARFPDENPNPVIRVTPFGELLYANDCARSLLSAWGCADSGKVPDLFLPHIVDSLNSNSNRHFETTCEQRHYTFVVTPLAEIGYVNLYGRDITKRVKITEDLQDHMQLFKTLLEAIPIPIFYKHTSGRYLGCNKSFAEYIGRDVQEIVGLTTYDVAPKELAEEYCSRDQDLYISGGVQKYESQKVYADGTLRNVIFHKAAFRDSAGDIGGLIGTVVDITDQKRSAKDLADALSESRRHAAHVEALLDGSRIILERKPFGVTANKLYDVCKKLIGAQTGYVALLNGESGENSDLIFLDSGDSGAWLASALSMSSCSLVEDACRERKVIYTNDFASSKYAGQLAEADVSLENVLFAPLILDDVAAGIFGFANKPGGFTADDIRSAEAFSELLSIALLNCRTLDSLSESEQRYRGVVQDLPILVCRYQPDTTLTFANRSYCEYFGIGSEEVIGRKFIEFVPEKYHEEIINRLGSLSPDKPSVSYEHEMMSKDGSSRWQRWTDRALFDEKGNAVGFQSFGEDIQEARNLEEQVRQLQKMEAMGRLAGGVAHDFNNILGIILGYCDLTKQSIEADDPMQDSMNEIREAAERATGLTRQLLAFSRKQVLRPKLLDTNDVIQSISKMLRRVIGEHIELVCNLAEDSGCFMADPGQVDQIFMNLAVNARDAMPDGGKFSIDAKLSKLSSGELAGQYSIPEGDYVSLTVSDTGHGMDEEVRKRIFEPFFTTKDKGKGTGLGLATVYGIVRQSEGFIDVASELGKGTSFSIYFPCKQDEDEIDNADKGKTLPAGGGETILFVEDEPILRKLSGGILESAGYKVLMKEDGEKALDFAKNYDGKLDILLTDVVMPQLNGPALAKEMSKLYPKIKVIYMSGYTGDVDAYDEIVKSKAPLLQKPFSSNLLLFTVRQLLDGGGTIAISSISTLSIPYYRLLEGCLMVLEGRLKIA